LKWSVISDKRQQELTNAQDKAPPRSYLEAMEALLKWIMNMESLLSSERFQVTDCDLMKEQLRQFRVSRSQGHKSG
jgi:dystrophin